MTDSQLPTMLINALFLLVLLAIVTRFCRLVVFVQHIQGAEQSGAVFIKKDHAAAVFGIYFCRTIAKGRYQRVPGALFGAFFAKAIKYLLHDGPGMLLVAGGQQLVIVFQYG